MSAAGVISLRELTDGTVSDPASTSGNAAWNGYVLRVEVAEERVTESYAFEP